jgi:hypothetical protein
MDGGPARLRDGYQLVRCRTHFSANLLSQTTKTACGWMKALMQSVFDQPAADAVREQFDRVVETLAVKMPELADYIDDAKEEVLTFTSFPKGVWKQIWSNNPLSVNRPSGDTWRGIRPGPMTVGLWGGCWEQGGDHDGDRSGSCRRFSDRGRLVRCILGQSFLGAFGGASVLFGNDACVRVRSVESGPVPAISASEGLRGRGDGCVRLGGLAAAATGHAGFIGSAVSVIINPITVPTPNICQNLKLGWVVNVVVKHPDVSRRSG